MASSGRDNRRLTEEELGELLSGRSLPPSCASCCHDFDKGLHNAVLPKDFKHGEASGDFIYKNWQRLGIESQAAAEYIDWIVRTHAAKGDFDEKLQQILDSYTLLNRTGDLRRLATLLKAADTLHIDESRICNLAVPDDTLQGFDRLKQFARENIHGWRPDGERIVIRVSVKSAQVAEALKICATYIRTTEWPPIDRNLRAYGFPHKIEFEWQSPPSIRDKLMWKGIIPSDGLDGSFERIAAELPATRSVTASLLVSDVPLRLIAVPVGELADYLSKAGPLSVIDNLYIEPKIKELGPSLGAVNRIFIGPANCGKTRAAYEWMRRHTEFDEHGWCVIRPESGWIPQDASKFIVDFEQHYDIRGRARPHRAILFADDLPEYLPPPGSGTAASEAVQRLLEWFHGYPGFGDRRFVGTVRSERIHDKPGWPDELAHMGDLRLIRIEALEEDQRRDLWKGMTEGRIFRHQGFQALNLEIDEEFLDAVVPLEADPEAIAYYVQAMADKGKRRIERDDAGDFTADVAEIWIKLTWPAVRQTYGPAASVFLTLARFIEAALRPDSGFPESLSPAWEYHAVFGPALLEQSGGKREDYNPALEHMLNDGHASGEAGEWVRPRFDFILQAPNLPEIELPLPQVSWFAGHANNLSSPRQQDIAYHFSRANQPYVNEGVTAHWLYGHAWAMSGMAEDGGDDATQGYEHLLIAAHEIVRRFGDCGTTEVRIIVATGLLWKAAALGVLGQAEEAVLVCDELVRCFGDEESPDLGKRVALGFIIKGTALRELGREEASVKAYDELMRRFGDDETPEVRRQVANSLHEKGALLSRLGRNEESIKAYDELLSRFGDDETPDFRRLIATGFRQKSRILLKLGRDEESVKAYDELLSRFGDDETSEIRELVAIALISKGLVMHRLGRDEEPVAQSNELLRRFGADETPGIRAAIITGIYMKGLALEELGREDEALKAYDELVRRFRDDEKPDVRQWVAEAILNKGIVLEGLCRDEEARAAYSEMERRFGDDDTPDIREQVIKGLSATVNCFIKLWRQSQNKKLLEEGVSAGRRAVGMGANCYNLACVWAGAGQLDEAFELLERSLGDGEIKWSEVAKDPNLARLHDDPRYQKLERKYGANAQEQANQGVEESKE